VTQRRFPPPWSVEELDACFVVQDSSGQKLGYFYYEEEPGRRMAYHCHDVTMSTRPRAQDAETILSVVVGYSLD
jgi:hypothetical protein